MDGLNQIIAQALSNGYTATQLHAIVTNTVKQLKAQGKYKAPRNNGNRKTSPKVAKKRIRTINKRIRKLREQIKRAQEKIASWRTEIKALKEEKAKFQQLLQNA